MAGALYAWDAFSWDRFPWDGDLVMETWTDIDPSTNTGWTDIDPASSTVWTDIDISQNF